MDYKAGVLSLFVSSLTVVCSADLVFSNTNQAPSGIAIIDVLNWVAVPFTTDNNAYNLTAASLDMSQLDDNSIEVEIWNMFELPGYGPDQSIGSLAFDGSASSSNKQVYAGSVALEANTSYFLVVLEPNGGNEFAGFWSQTSSLDADIGVPWQYGLDLTDDGVPDDGTYRDFTSSNLGATWSQPGPDSRGLFTLDAVVVPEPMTLSLIGISGAGMLMYNRIRRREEG